MLNLNELIFSPPYLLKDMRRLTLPNRDHNKVLIAI